MILYATLAMEHKQLVFNVQSITNLLEVLVWNVLLELLALLGIILVKLVILLVLGVLGQLLLV